MPDVNDRSGFFGVFGYSRRAVSLVWTTNPRLTLSIAALTAAAGVLPAAIAWVGARIVDAVVNAVASTHDPAAAQYAQRTLHLDKGRFVERGLAA